MLSTKPHRPTTAGKYDDGDYVLVYSFEVQK